MTTPEPEDPISRTVESDIEIDDGPDEEVPDTDDEDPAAPEEEGEAGAQDDEACDAG